MNFRMDFDITSNIPQIKREMIKQAKLGLKAVGATAAGYAQEDCPVDTGLLRNSIAYGLAGDFPHTTSGGTSYSDNKDEQSGGYSSRLPELKADELAVYIGSNVEYAPYVEFKDMNHTSGKAHFLRDAIANNMDEFEEILHAALAE